MKKLNFLKNKVGRPSNEVKSTRRFIIVSSVCCGLVFISFLVFVIANKIDDSLSTSINIRAASVTYHQAHQCIMPYSAKNCGNVKNETVKMIQKFLYTVNKKYYSSKKGTGEFDYNTIKGVRDFQSETDGLTSDGYVGPKTLKKLASLAYKKGNTTKYYIIEYDKNKGSGELNSSYDDVQVVLSGISTQLSSTRLNYPGYRHIGWQPSNNLNVRYDLGENFTFPNDSQGHKITMKAVWCKNSDYKGDNSRGTCSKIVLSLPKLKAAFPISTVEYSSKWMTCTNAAKNQNCGSYVSRGFCLYKENGRACLVTNGLSDHYGIDFITRDSEGGRSVPVYSAYPGRVVKVKSISESGGYGNLVIIGHEYDSKYKGYHFYTAYAHLAEAKVKVGDPVSANMYIANSGNTGGVKGRLAYHLHFELRIPKTPGTNGGAREDGKNPEKFFNAMIKGNIDNVVNQIKERKY